MPRHALDSDVDAWRMKSWWTPGSQDYLPLPPAGRTLFGWGFMATNDPDALDPTTVASLAGRTVLGDLWIRHPDAPTV